MREIKFRAWDRERKEMWYQDKMFFVVGFRLGGNEIIKERATSIDNFFTPLQGETMQYTGLKDKNSKEIYEGDILRFRNYKDDLCEGLVEWNEEWLTYDFGGDNHWDCDKETIEIIGDIYENPELLDRGKV